MNKFFKMALIVFGLVVALFVGLLFYGKSSGEKTAKAFFEKIEKSKANQFDQHVFFNLSSQADPELIRVFFKEVLNVCGSFKGLAMNGMHFSDKIDRGDRLQNYKGKFNFEKKSIEIELSFINDQLSGFSVNDQGVAQQALERSHTVGLDNLEKKYSAEGKRFLNVALSDSYEGAFDMVHEALQKQVGKANFIKIFKKIFMQYGEVKKIEYKHFKQHPEEKNKVVYFYQCDFEKKKNITCTCSISFSEFQGHILGWKVKL